MFQNNRAAEASVLIDESDEQLVQAIACRNEQAFEIFFERHRELIKSIGIRILFFADNNGKQEVEDFVQEFFLEFFSKAAGNYDASRGTVQAWLVSLAYSKALHKRRYDRQLRRWGDKESHDVDDFARTLIDERGSLEARIISARMVDRAWDCLSETQKTILKLVFFEGYGLRDIAVASGISYGNVSHLYYRGLKRLREELDGSRKKTRIKSTD